MHASKNRTRLVMVTLSATCRRLKEIADQTAVGRIAYLLRKRDPMWARLHKGAVRQGLRSASAILAFMETNLHKAKTKTRLPTGTVFGHDKFICC